METVYAMVERRIKKTVARADHDKNGRSGKETDAFETCKLAIAHRVTATHRDKSEILCIYTDTSDNHFSGIVKQVPSTYISLLHADQCQKPHIFYSVCFSVTKLCLSTLEEKQYAFLVPVEHSH